MSILSSTNIQPFGIIPFNSDDPSVALNCSLKTAADVAAAGGTVVGAPTFSAEGFTTTNSAADYVRFELPSGFEALTYAGQISYDVDLEFVSDSDGGFDAAANAFLLSAAPLNSGGGQPLTRHWKPQANDGLILQADSVDGQNIINISALDTETTVRITESWVGSQSKKYIDGRLIIDEVTRNSALSADRYKFVWIGTDRGNAGPGLYGYRVKNLVISTRPVMLPAHPALANTVMIGHSFVTGGVDALPTQLYGYDKSLGRCVKGPLSEKGLDLEITYYGTSGATLDPSTGLNLDSQFVAAVATRPTCAVIIAGTNDVSSGTFSAAAFEAAYKSYIDDLSATAEIIVVTTVPTSIGNSSVYTQTVIDNTATVNTIIATLPDYNPKVVVSDSSALTGGETEGNNYWRGEFTGVYDDRHYTAKGGLVIGSDIGAKIFAGLSK